MTPDTDHQLSEPDEGAVLAAPRETTTAELLGLCDEFFRQTSPAVHTELRKFLTERGHHPNTSLGAFLDGLGFATLDRADPGRV
jgi:hypothetical protein